MKPLKLMVKQWLTFLSFVKIATVTVSQTNPEKLKLYDLSGVYGLAPTTVIDDEDGPIHWSCERFWCIMSFDFCLLRRYIEIEVEIEELEDE